MRDERLEKLVPPLSLCCKIPDGAFTESALVWIADDYLPAIELVRRAELQGEHVVIPAPTLEEIMKDLPASVCYHLVETWTVALCNDTVCNGVKSRRAATAALRLWLDYDELKGRLTQKKQQ